MKERGAIDSVAKMLELPLRLSALDGRAFDECTQHERE